MESFRNEQWIIPKTSGSARTVYDAALAGTFEQPGSNLSLVRIAHGR